MKRILVPIDFSASSGNALRYAQQLAQQLSFGLSLLHCYPIMEYSRPYDFGKKDYHTGVREMLRSFYKEWIEEEEKGTRFLAKTGSVVSIVAAIGHDFQLVVLSSNTLGSKFTKWMGSKASSIASTARCPVMIVSPSVKYHAWKKVWHINRRENEAGILKKYLPKLKIDPATIETKFLDQTSFSSLLWRSIITYVKTKKEVLRQVGSQMSKEEEIDLVILVSHRKNTFHKFVNHEGFQVIFQFNMPVLVFQAPTK